MALGVPILKHFRVYLEDRRVMIKGCVNWNFIFDRKDFHYWESYSGPLDQ